jgi:hypothetical protein
MLKCQRRINLLNCETAGKNICARPPLRNDPMSADYPTVCAKVTNCCCPSADEHGTLRRSTVLIKINTEGDHGALAKKWDRSHQNRPT